MICKTQQISEDVFNNKYAKTGETRDDCFRRVARHLDPLFEGQYYELMQRGCIPAGRIMSNAGIEDNTSLINCTVGSGIEDSMESIMDSVKEFGLTLKAGCGIGECFSYIRPKDSLIAGTGSAASGPLSFMEVHDRICKTIRSGGGRRGAIMATLHVWHPDILDFISAKRKAGALRNMNLSVLIPDDFMVALKNNEDYALSFPNKDGTITRDGQAHKVYRQMPSREIWDAIMHSNYNYAEPGIIFIDRVNDRNPLWFHEKINATNPCGEQPLPAGGSCLLGSINLTKYILDDDFDYPRIYEDAQLFSRLLDDVVDKARLPLKAQRDSIQLTRRHGMGIFGLGSAFNIMNVRYGSDLSVEMASKVMHTIERASAVANIALAKEKGMAPIFRLTTKITEQHLKAHLDLPYQVGDVVSNLDLYLHGNHLYPVKPVDGLRYTHATSIAPTGTMALAFGNNASNGIEPSFSHSYTRNVVKEGGPKTSYEVYSYESLVKPDRQHISTDDLTPADHIAVMAAAQKHVDSSISKTINVASDISFEAFKDIYLECYKKGLKSATTYRFNPEGVGSVLVRDKDLKTLYTVYYDDGPAKTLPGSTEVTHNGMKTNIHNLYEAMRNEG